MRSPRIARLQLFNSQLKKRSFSTYVRYLEVLLRSIEFPQRDEFLQLLLKKDFTGLVALADSCSSTVYTTAKIHRLANQISAVIRKFPFPPGSVNLDPRAKATETFLRAEHKCRRVNQRFVAYRKVRSPYESMLQNMRSWISYTLGDFSYEDLFRNCRFGPGASIGVTGSRTSMGRKMLASKWSVTTGAINIAKAVLKVDPLYWELLVKEPRRETFSYDPDIFDKKFHDRICVTDHNKITFVPKTAKTERTIAVEPLLNGYLQLGCETLLRKRLKRVGIDITDQTINQRLARLGSTLSDDPWVTIDLSAASDSISRELCRDLLPPDWFYVLDQLRSPSYKLCGEVIPFHKFVTMGNGFCFPLETLLFGAACEAAAKAANRRPEYSVYGDDIICRQSVAPTLISILKMMGFKTNSDKTFLSGPFRESCGADWFEGEDVRPITLDYAFDSVESIFKFSNICRSKDIWTDIFCQANEFLVSLIPRDLLFCRPYKGVVDSALEVPLDVFLASPYARWHRDVQSFSWYEVQKSSAFDVTLVEVDGYSVALMAGALSGMSNPWGERLVGDNSPSPFTERRKTRTKIRRKSYSGSTSNWRPAVDLHCHGSTIDILSLT